MSGSSRREMVGFVGRESELTRLAGALDAAAVEGPRLVHVQGPGGIGKTTLAFAFARRAEAAGHRVAFLSGEYTAPTPTAIGDALRELSLPAWDELGRDVARADLVILDGFDPITPIAHWLTHVMPRAGSHLLVLVSSRAELDPRVRTALPLAEQFQELGLVGLSREESKRLLAASGVPEREQECLHDATAGLPLALALVAEQYRRDPRAHRVPVDPAALMRGLVRQLVEDSAAPGHRALLDALSVARVTDERLLRAILGDEVGGTASFDWLASQSFVRQRPEGLVPHDVIRQLLHRDLSERTPDRRRRYARAAIEELTGRLDPARPEAARRQILDALYAGRDAPLVAALELERLRPTYLRPVDEALDDARALIERHEGAGGRESFEAWRATGRGAAHLICDANGAIGICAQFPVLDCRDQWRSDPLFQAAAETARGLPEGGTVFFRWMCTARGYQALDEHMVPVMFSGPAQTAQLEVVPRFALFAQPPEWAPLAPAFSLRALEGGRLSWQGHDYQLFLVDLAQLAMRSPRSSFARSRATSRSSSPSSWRSQPPTARRRVGSRPSRLVSRS